MFGGLNEWRDATAAAAASEQRTITWTTPLSHDPELPDRLKRAHAELMLTADLLAEAAERHATGAVADAARSCAEQMHALNRLEALRLYPVIALRYESDPAGFSAFTRARLEVNILGRRFLRLVESCLADGIEGALGVSDARLAIALLRRYVEEKQARVYPPYAPA